jgi:ATP-dependent RNA helicase RhlE
LAASKVPLRPKSVRALILTPTRELALQINDSFRAYGRHLRLSTTVVMGGVGHGPQIKALARGIDILIATPGRLNDLLEQRHVQLGQVEVFVLDEADRMLDMGFIRDVRKIIAGLPVARQTMLFSATMPGDIAKLAGSILKEPVRVEVTPVSSTAERIDQKVLFVDKGAKHKLLGQVLKDTAIARAIIFTRTKHGANKVGEVLERGAVMAEVIHGNKSQGARQKALDNFRAGRSRVLVATDIAARGIDVDGITHVINFDLPNDPESYVHRIGRTARAGAEGFAISFCDATERSFLRDIEKLTRQRIPAESAGITATPRQAREPGEGRRDGEGRSNRDGHSRHNGHRRQADGEQRQGEKRQGDQRQDGRHQGAKHPDEKRHSGGHRPSGHGKPRHGGDGSQGLRRPSGQRDFGDYRDSEKQGTSGERRHGSQRDYGDYRDGEKQGASGERRLGAHNGAHQGHSAGGERRFDERRQGGPKGPRRNGGRHRFSRRPGGSANAVA